ncbi:elongation factor G [Stratiformator vulcanicus]|uniref:Elongation factor G n=1 Tax=Stratiformator vulcanicus TaxID=2527980 RepID=A0A517R2T0_9PLAN|nr:elongation factor G [Stratiformator vulcanicus]QDT38153.1 Elongation factor G [Stratiformator vulcanicus]
MAVRHVDELRNVALVGHAAVGKTTLADRMLFKAGVIPQAGSVDDGTSFLDAEDEERSRHMSIFSHICHFAHNGTRINLLDTPGFPDFAGQLAGALRAVETAVVVIHACHGIEVNSRRGFQEAAQEGLARMILINDCDCDGADLKALLENTREMFGSECVPMNLPVGEGGSFKSVVSVLNSAEASASELPISFDEVRQMLIDAIVESDDKLMERFFDGEELSEQDLVVGATRAMLSGTLIPIFFASASADVGVAELMDALATYAPSPAKLPHQAVTADGRVVDLVPSEDGPAIGQVFKTRIDQYAGKLSYVRIFSGRLTKDATVTDFASGRTVKLHGLLDLQGGQQEGAEEAFAGDIVAVPKVEELHVGDTIGMNGAERQLPPIRFPKPVIGLAVEPKSRSDQQKISTALHRMEEEDQTFHFTRDDETNEMVIQGMSELHLKLVEERLHTREHVDIVTHTPRVPYRETVTGEATDSYRHKKQSGGAGQFAEVHLRVSQLPPGINPDEYFTKDRFEHLRHFHHDPDINFAFVDRVSGGSVPNQFIPAVEKGVREQMRAGVAAGYQVQDVCVELFFGKDHPVDSNENAFKAAGRNCFKKVFEQAKPTLLEPVVRAEITVPDETVGAVTGDISTRRGRVEGLEPAGNGLETITAVVPLAEMLTYARVLSSLSAGKGQFTMAVTQYELMPHHEQQKVLEPVGEK